MMSFITLLFKNKLGNIFIGICVAVLAAIVIPNLGTIAGLFGYKTKAAVVQELNDTKKELEDTIKANATLLAEIEFNKKTVENLKSSIANLETIRDTNNSFINTVIANKDSELTKLNNSKYEDIILNSDNVPVSNTITINKSKSQAISKIQIKAIWDSYCNFNNDSVCRG